MGMSKNLRGHKYRSKCGTMRYMVKIMGQDHFLNHDYVGKEYVEDKKRVSMRFDVKLYSPAKLLPFEFFYKKRKITGAQERQYLTVSFIENLPRTLIDDIAWNRKNAERYVYGYIFTPLQRVNQEMFRQRYSLGHFLVNTFSFFDIVAIKLTNIEEEGTDEIISMPWPPVAEALPNVHFPKSPERVNPEIFVRDYIDACSDFFRGDYDNCVKRMITSVENALSAYKLQKKKKKYPWWKFIMRFNTQDSFTESIRSLWPGSKFLGHQVVSSNLLFLYKIRNKITHGSLRIHQENGWWFCGRGLQTLQYFYQFLDGNDENSPGAYVFYTSVFASSIFRQTRGSTVEIDAMRGEFLNENRANEDLLIRTDKDLNDWKFNSLLITNSERISIINSRPRIFNE